MFKRFISILAFALAAWHGQAATVIPSTTYTRDFMRSSDSAAARAKLGMSAFDTSAAAITTNAANNSVALSNFWNAGGGLLPPGIITFTNPFTVHASGSKVLGNGRTTLRYTGPTNKFAITLAGKSNFIYGVVFDFQQDKHTASPASTSWGALFANPIGGLVVQDCAFRNISGTCIYIHGDSDIIARSNAWRVLGCDFFSFGHGVRGAQTNRSEFGTVAVNTFYDFTGDGIFVGGANNLIYGNMLDGYVGSVDLNGGRERGIVLQPSITGSDPGRSHSIVSGNHCAHTYVDLAVLDCTIGSGLVAGNNFAGGAYTIISNTFNMTVINNLLNPYVAVIMTNNTSLTFAQNHVVGTIIGTNNLYYGGGNINGSGNFFATDVLQAGKYFIEGAGTLQKYGTDQMAITKWSGGYGTLVADKFWSLGAFWLNNAGMFSYQSEANTVSLDAWSGGLGNASFRLGAVKFTGNATPPALSAFGGALFSDGTNMCVVLQNAGGVKTTNRLTQTPY